MLPALAHWGPLPLTEDLPDKAQREEYKLLCPDNTWRPVDEYKQCHLARVPSHAIVARSVNGREDLIWEFLRQAQVAACGVLPTCLELGEGWRL